MPRTTFTTKHFLACLSVSWEGTPGTKTRRTLEGVGYTLEMPPGAEPPFELDELWLFARFYRKGAVGRDPRMRLVVTRLTGSRPIRFRPVDLGSVSMSHVEGVIDIAWPIRPFSIVLGGRYEIRLQTVRQTFRGLKWKTVGREYLFIEERR